MQELTRIRNERGWSQQKLSDVAKVNKATINQIERGRRSPNVETLEKLAAALGVELGDFFPKAQAPLPLKEGERGHFSFKEAREGLDKYCEHWEQLLAKNELDDRAMEEFFVTGDGWIPVMDVALRAELGQLRRTSGIEVSELLAKSEIAQANQRYLDVFSAVVEEIRGKYDQIPAEPAAIETNVVRLQEVRERLIGMQSKAVG